MVIILLAAYNGSEYIKEQLESIISQTFQDWQLYIRDDNSTDDTSLIIHDYLLKDKRIHMLKDDRGNLRSSQNFDALMTYCQNLGNYFMFCDQDDIWMPDKISESVKAIKSIEKVNQPALCYGTYEHIDKAGNKINSGEINYDFGLNIRILLAMNYIYGCTIIINKNLLKKCLNISLKAENHDYWIALIAALSDANFKYISKPCLYYRQHGNNVSGSYTDSGFRKRLDRLFKNTEINAIFSKFAMFQDAVHASSGFSIDNKRELVGNYIAAFNKGRFTAFIFVVLKRIRKITMLSTMNYYFSIIIGNKSKDLSK